MELYTFVRQSRKSVAVANLSVIDPEIEEIDTSQLTRMGTSVQGVLSADFLKERAIARP